MKSPLHRLAIVFFVPNRIFLHPSVTNPSAHRLAFETMNLEFFESRVLPTKNKLYRFALRLLANEEEAKDVVQEVLIRVWRNQGSVDEIQNWEAWCMRITKNLSLDRLRVTQRRITASLDQESNVRDLNGTPHETTEQQESMQRINQLMATLPEKQRQVIHLRDVEGYSYNEICDMLELDMNQVKVSLFRARNAIKEKLIKLNAYGL